MILYRDKGKTTIDSGRNGPQHFKFLRRRSTSLSFLLYLSWTGIALTIWSLYQSNAWITEHSATFERSMPSKLEYSVSNKKHRIGMASTNATTSNQNRSFDTTMTTTADVKRVVIATKIHGIHQWGLLEQSQCLFHHAYNNYTRALHDVVVFTTEPVPQSNVDSLQRLLSISASEHGRDRIRLRVVVDNLGSLAEEIEALPPDKKSAFVERCVKAHKQQEQSIHQDEDAIMKNLTWFSDCGDGRLAYNWQAEFRSRRIWEHPALSPYRYMLWLDADAFATRPIRSPEHDPVQIAKENKLVLLFAQFPNGGSRNLGERISNGFLFGGDDGRLDPEYHKHRLCRLRLTPRGELESTFQMLDPATYNQTECDWNNTLISGVNGFFHVTDLDFYRQPRVLNGIDALLGNCFLCRFPDDQLAVTIPAAMYAPSQSWELQRATNTSLGIFHNYRIDGKDSDKVSQGFKQLWKLKRLRQAMRGARGICPVTEKD